MNYSVIRPHSIKKTHSESEDEKYLEDRTQIILNEIQ